jgi:hypothetical protein
MDARRHAMTRKLRVVRVIGRSFDLVASSSASTAATGLNFELLGALPFGVLLPEAANVLANDDSLPKRTSHELHRFDNILRESH